ncbi:carbon-nitrogen hydrolase family protein [Kiloniella sp. EL199]|uniref:carbon-nitrogen hydrolase family protein n=1 Tax=Kiloniella sp. EL199 TaxID=2107581 RepID=UPI000EA03985|nr:carbon-nitrogen hydrolase family protein [Kiloniella sp. EL199]
MNELTVVIAQNPATLNGPDERFQWLKENLSNTQIEGADFLLLPELFLTGYNVGERVHVWSEAKDGFFAKKIADLCRAHNIAIHYGYSESHDGRIYNSAQCFGKNGQRLGEHRKLMLPPGFEREYFQRGGHCEVFSLNGFNIGTLICYDAEFPENFRHIAKMGVDLVLVPTALGAQWGVVAHKVMPTRAFENGIYVCYANQCGNENGLEFLGGSCIIGPDGHDLERASMEPEFLRAQLNLNAIKSAQKRLPYLEDLKRLTWSGL